MAETDLEFANRANIEVARRFKAQRDALAEALQALMRFCDEATLYEKENPDHYAPYINARAALALSLDEDGMMALHDDMAKALELIADIAEGSGTVNSLPHIAKIARGTLALSSTDGGSGS